MWEVQTLAPGTPQSADTRSCPQRAPSLVGLSQRLHLNERNEALTEVAPS